MNFVLYTFYNVQLLKLVKIASHSLLMCTNNFLFRYFIKNSVNFEKSKPTSRSLLGRDDRMKEEATVLLQRNQSRA